jgi:regulator of RNase E activity RraA
LKIPYSLSYSYNIIFEKNTITAINNRIIEGVNMDKNSLEKYEQLKDRFTNMTPDKIGTMIISRPSKEVVRDIRSMESPAADCADALHALGFSDFGIPATILGPVIDRKVAIGPALTILNEPGHSDLWPYEFTDVFVLSEPGDFIAISGEGYEHTGSWGGTTTGIASELQLAGTISRWPCRDRDVILKHGYPVWVPGHTPLPTVQLITKAIMVPIELHGVTINPGDLIVADSTGVVVIPQSAITDVHDRIKRTAESVRNSHLLSIPQDHINKVHDGLNG